jgi:hypothetical protein
MSTFKTLYLHIGSEKTGTKALQKSLAATAPILMKEGVLYHVVANPMNPDSVGHHHGIVNAITIGDFELLQAELSLMEAQLSPRIRKIVVSSEFFFHLLDHNPHAERGLAAIRAWAKQLGFSFNVVVYLRRQDQLLASLYSQRVKWDGLTLSFDEWAEGLIDSYDYQKKMDAWVKCCDVLHVEIYEKKNIGDSIVGHFLKTIGVPKKVAADVLAADLFTEENFGNQAYVEKNLSLTPAAVAVMQALYAKDPGDVTSVSEMIQEHADASFYSAPFDGAELLTKEQRDRIVGRFLKSNSKLARQFRIGHTRGLFTAPRDKGRGNEAIEPQSATIDLVAHLCLALMRENRRLRANAEELTPGVISPGMVECRVWFPRGWCRPEPWGAWTLGSNAEIILNLPHNCSWVRLTFDLTSYVPDIHAQNVTVLLDGENAAHWHFDAQSQNQLQVIERWVDPNLRTHVIELAIPTACSPLSLGYSSDHRSLGVGLRQVDILTRLRGARE